MPRIHGRNCYSGLTLAATDEQKFDISLLFNSFGSNEDVSYVWNSYSQEFFINRINESMSDEYAEFLFKIIRRNSALTY